MIERYSKRAVLNNNKEMYSNILRNRFFKSIKHFETVKYNIDYDAIAENTQILEHIWKVGDKFYKLSNQYYGDPRDWWIIALYNSLPTESHIKVGDVILIPTPLIQVLEYITY